MKKAINIRFLIVLLISGTSYIRTSQKPSPLKTFIENSEVIQDLFSDTGILTESIDSVDTFLNIFDESERENINSLIQAFENQFSDNFINNHL